MHFTAAGAVRVLLLTLWPLPNVWPSGCSNTLEFEARQSRNRDNPVVQINVEVWKISVEACSEQTSQSRQHNA